MEIVCITDVDDVRGKVLEEVQKASNKIVNSAKLFTFSFKLLEELDLEENDELKTVYYADVVIVDWSISVKLSSLSYFLGCRHNIGMNQNIILCNHLDDEVTLRLKLPCDNSITYISYKLADCGTYLITNLLPLGNDNSSAIESTKSVAAALEILFKEVYNESKVPINEKFLSDLKTNSGLVLRKKLLIIRKHLKDPCVTVDVLHSMMEAFRDVQDYDGMVQLVEDVQAISHKRHFTQTPLLQYLYYFALYRSNKPGYRKKALLVIKHSLEENISLLPDLICLYGRVYKDKYVESIFKDSTALQDAIHWYRKAFKIQPNLHAGINLATLLFVAGNEFSKSEELQRIDIFLNHCIGKKGHLTSINDYWIIATYFEINVLTENYSKAIKAAECMFKLKPLIWYYKSTIRNIKLIWKFRKKSEEIFALEKYLKSWIEYFVDATKHEIDSDICDFPVIVLESSKVYFPSYVKVNLDIENKYISLDKQYTKDCKQMQNWLFLGSAIRSVSICNVDERCLFLCTNPNYDSFQIYFPSTLCRQRFYDLVKSIIDNYEGFATKMNKELLNKRFVYELDDYQNKKQKKILGHGTYGKVYAAFDCNTKVQIAVKEIPETKFVCSRALPQEVQLHSQLCHRNIVRYLGSISVGGYLKIFMEQVPESLSSLLKLKWGPLKKDERVISFYTKQILEGLKYLHEQKIIHRDIKGDNILINMFSGVAKISDFGISKRLSELYPTSESFMGTIEYMAPEVIKNESSGYGTSVDIWSLGCTVVEMATGRKPYEELGSRAAVIYTVGEHKRHPYIPVELKYQAYCFILRCFLPDQNLRATATDLLKDLFISEYQGMPSAN